MQPQIGSVTKEYISTSLQEVLLAQPTPYQATTQKECLGSPHNYPYRAQYFSGAIYSSAMNCKTTMRRQRSDSGAPPPVVPDYLIEIKLEKLELTSKPCFFKSLLPWFRTSVDLRVT